MKRNIDIDKFINFRDPESSVLIVEGARQVGKTYFLNDVLAGKDHISIDLEKEKVFRSRIDETKDFDEFQILMKTQKGLKDGALLFIDEAQESEKLGDYVRYMKESWRNVKTILTGSSMTKLFRNTARVPVGRVSYVTIHPFSFREFLRFIEKEAFFDTASELFLKKKSLPSFLHHDLLTLFDDYLFCGGMPKSVVAYAKKDDFSEVLSGLIISQQDDFLRKEPNLSRDLYMRALRGIAGHVGGSSKYTHVSDNHHSAKKIVEVLKSWLLVLEIEQCGSIETQAFLPKRYLYDIGVLRHAREAAIAKLSVIHTLDEKLRIPMGGLIENFVLIELLRGTSRFHGISSWKKSNKDNIEVDFIYKKKDQTIPIEVKASVKVHERHFKNLVYYLNEQQISNGILVSLGNIEQFKLQNKHLINIPAYLFSRDLLEIFK
ncbi:MAG: AAA family ATPase [Pseudomonadota bacterium]